MLAMLLGMNLGFNFILCTLFLMVKMDLIVTPPIESTSWQIIHYFLPIQSDRLQLALQWTVYSIFLCIFHLGEFFSTCVFNPSVTTSDSFMINQSKAYTAAALVSSVCCL